MLLLDKGLEDLLKEIKKANRLRKTGEPMIEFTLVVKNPSTTNGPPRVMFIDGEAPVSFWESKQAKNLYDATKTTRKGGL